MKYVVFAMGCKGKLRADLEQAKTHKTPTPNLTPTQKHKSHVLNSVRGRLLGYAQNKSRRTKYLRFVNRLIELQFLSFIACKTKCEHNSNTCLFNGTSNVSKILTDNVRESQVRAP